MELIKNTENIVPNGPTLEKALDQLAQAKSIRSQYPLRCFLADIFGLNFLHKFAPGPTYETMLGDTKILWNLKICRKCFSAKKQIIAEATFSDKD